MSTNPNSPLRPAMPEVQIFTRPDSDVRNHPPAPYAVVAGALATLERDEAEDWGRYCVEQHLI